jgi:hypothetical protein
MTSCSIRIPTTILDSLDNDIHATVCPAVIQMKKGDRGRISIKDMREMIVYIVAAEVG